MRSSARVFTVDFKTAARSLLLRRHRFIFTLSPGSSNAFSNIRGFCRVKQAAVISQVHRHCGLFAQIAVVSVKMKREMINRFSLTVTT
jgi:hypothetical protein